MSALRYSYSALRQQSTPHLRAAFGASPGLLERREQKKHLVARLESTYVMGIDESDAQLQDIASDSTLTSVLLEIAQDQTIDGELRALGARLYTTQVLDRLPPISDLEESLRFCLVSDKEIVREGVRLALEDHHHYDLIARLFPDGEDA